MRVSGTFEKRFETAKTLRERGRFCDAELCLLELLKVEPERSVEVWAELGEIAVKQRDWANAAVRWAKVIELSSPPSIHAYVRLSQALRARAEHGEALELILSARSVHGDHLGLLMEEAEVYSATKNWPKARKYWERVVSMSKNKPSDLVKRRLRQAEISEASVLGEKAYCSLVEGEVEASVKYFTDAINISPFPNKAEWIDFFHDLVGKAFNGVDFAVDNYAPPVVKKILISGMGWSGSSALFDYLREYKGVCPIDGEFQHIEGSYGLRSLDRESPDLLGRLIDFFFNTVVGLRAQDERAIQKSCQSAWDFMLVESQTYLNATRWFIGEYLSGPHDGSRFEQIARRYLDGVIGSRLPLGERLALLDNVVHAWNLECLRYLADFSLYIVVRDPRAQFVAMCLENARYHRDVNLFVREFRDRSARHDASFLDLRDSSKSRIRIIRFEDFVRDERLRVDIGKRATDGGVHTAPRKFFDPTLSAKNIEVHKGFSNQADIAKIEEELSAFCYL